MEERIWSEGLEAQWQGLEVDVEVKRAFGDLNRIADRLSSVRAYRGETRVGAHIDQAVGGLTLAVNALLASADIKCTLDQPPEEVNTRPRGPDGKMITQCFHDPPHCWDGVGDRISPCPS